MRGVKWFLVACTGGLLALLGSSKFREVRAIQNILIAPGKHPFKISKVADGLVTIILEIVFSNPSSFKIEVQDFQSTIYFRGRVLAEVPALVVVISPGKKTTVSIPVTIVWKDFLRLSEEMLLNLTVPVHFDGSLTYVSPSVSVPIPVPFEYDLDVKAEINAFMKENYGAAIPTLNI